MNSPRTLSISALVATAAVTIALLAEPTITLITLGALAAVASVVACVWSPRLSWFILTVAFLCNRFVIELGPVDLRLEHLALVALLLSLRTPGNALAKSVASKVLLAAGGFAAWLILSTVVSTERAPEPVRSYYVIALYALAFCAFLLVTMGSDTTWRAIFSLRILSAFCLASVSSWVGAELFGLTNPLVILNNYETTHRVQGLMVEPNFFGTAAALWLCVMFAYRAHLKQAEIYIHVATLGSCVALSYTRAAWVATALICAVVFVTSSRNRFRQVLGASIFACAAFLFTTITPTGSSAGLAFGARFGTLFSFDTGTGAFRARDWETATNQLRGSDGWVLGLGVNSYSQRNASLETSSGEGYLGNLWLALLYDGGVFGLALMLAVFILILSMRRKDPALWSAVATVALTSGATNSMWFMFPWVALALIVARTESTSSNGDSGSARRFKARRNHVIA